MSSREFCYWLQGFFELGEINSSGLSTGPQTLSAEQSAIIKRHLGMVFVREIDPSYPKEQQANLNAWHANSASTPGSTPRC